MEVVREAAVREAEVMEGAMGEGRRWWRRGRR